MNTRRYPRTMNDAFKTGPEYGCSIERPRTATVLLTGRWRLLLSIWLVC